MRNHASYDPAFGEPYCKAVATTIPALPHDYHMVSVAPSCTEPGYIAEVCSVCGHTERGAFATDITDQFNWSEGYVISAVNGNKMADRNWVASDYVDISQYVSIEIVTGDTVNANTTLGIAFYDASYRYISGVLHTDKVGNEYGILVHNLKIPDNAVYVRSTWYSVNHDKYNGATIHTFYCKGYTEEIPATGHTYQNGVCVSCSTTVDGAIWQIIMSDQVIGAYATLQDAVNACEAGATIRLMEDCAVTAGVVLNKSITINGGDHFVDISDCRNAFITVSEGISVVIRDLKQIGRAHV